MKALVIGATGATGKDLVTVLLNDAAYTSVVAFVRRPAGIIHPKLTEIKTDFDKLEELSAAINGDAWFSCLGTTLKAAGGKEKQWHIDYEMPLKFAQMAKANGVSKAVLLSAYGASVTSNIFYSKMKGQLEAEIIKLGFERCIIFRPGLLLRKDTDRPVERVMAGLLKFLNRVGFAMKFRPMPTSVLAEKLAKAPTMPGAGVQVVELEKIFAY